MFGSPTTTASSSAPEIDWELLMLLARTEAAMRWPEEMEVLEPSPALPDGLDLRHGSDLDWVSKVVAERSPSPLPPLRLEWIQS